MRGYKNFNRDKFNEAEKKLLEQGHTVFNPVSLDMERGWTMDSETGDANDLPGFNDQVLREIVAADISELLACDAIYLLPGWRKSKGATAEYHVAMWAGLKDYYDFGS